MGNHEYCEDCGESDFHRHRPCDPEKLETRRREKELNDAEHKKCVAMMVDFFRRNGIEYSLTEYGNATVSCHQFKGSS